MPTTAGGSTIGRSTTSSTKRVRPRGATASHQASGVPVPTTIARLSTVVRALSQRAGANSGSPMPAARSTGEEASANAMSGSTRSPRIGVARSSTGQRPPVVALTLP